MKIENLERHVKNQHPREQVDLGGLITEAERREISKTKAAARPPITPRGKRIVAVVAIAIALLLVLVILNPFRPVGPDPGQLAPDFSLASSTGGTFTLSAYRGFPILLEFMDVDCPACLAEAPILVSLYDNYSVRGVRFVAVDVNFVGQADTLARLEQYRQDEGAEWVHVLDSNRFAVNAYGIGSTPTTFFLDRNGVVLRDPFIGRANGGYADYAAALEEALGA